MPHRDPAPAVRLFAPRRVLLCLLPFLVLALWMLALSGLATAGDRATAGSPARLSVSVPTAAKSANIVMLEVGISVVRKPRSSQLGAVVRVGSNEVGRVSITGTGQSYQFNVGHALAREGGSATVEVELIDRSGDSVPSGAELSIGRAQIVTR
jgi:hypothetical protein